MYNTKLNYFIATIFILILYFIYIYKRHIPHETFENRMINDENYTDPFDKEFVDFYEIIYRDSTDLKTDYNFIKEKTLNDPHQENTNILIAGSGVGKLAALFKKNYKNITGVDKSENMIKKSYELNPNIKFIKGDLLNPLLFEKNMFSHIIFDNNALNYNSIKDMNIILHNCSGWLKEKGYLITPIFDQNKMRVSPRYYTTNYIDNKKVVHGYTYLNGFAHDGYLVQDDSKGTDDIIHFDKIILEDGQHRIKKTELFIPKKEDLYETILKRGFVIDTIGTDLKRKQENYELVIFKKTKKIMDVNELEKNYNK
tara:strand:+ start:265 stop:1200 length:936 start_codon:yes stop_codon:yes gene_type:complete